MANDTSGPPSGKRKPGLALTLVGQLVGLVSLGTWLFIALFAPMYFDGGTHWRSWALFYASLAGPVLVAAALVLLWVAYFKRRPAMHLTMIIFLVLSLAPLIGAFG